MIVSHQARVLFVHVQKTGGSTLDQVLLSALPDAERPAGLRRHTRLRKALRKYPELADYWTFGFVRNPWARMLSWYVMIKRVEQEAAAGSTTRQVRQLTRNPMWRAVVSDYPDFEAFVLRGTEEFRELRQPQVSYFEAGERTADFIGRQESFEDDLRTVLDHLGAEWPADVPRINANPPRDHREAYSPASRDRVAELFAEDLRRFGYEF